MPIATPIKQVEPEENIQIAVSIKDEQIAIIGLAGRYPQANNMEEFWENLKKGRDCVTEVPAERWNIDLHYDANPQLANKSYCKQGGFIEGVEYFDPLFFGISPLEAEMMDPQQRLLMEVSWQALEDAGYSADALNNTNCGIYVGVMNHDYETLIARSHSLPNAQQVMGNSNAILAARMAYYLNLKGPVITLDTACSSSLVAIHMACQSLLHHEADMMLAGGVTLYLTEEPYIGMSRAGMLSPEGLCKTFDNQANGFVPGEGCGVVILKRLSEAIRDKDIIYGVIRGSGVNQDGKTNGITAPSGESQKTLELNVYHKAQIHPEEITYVEAHGTGTKLGDPIEVHALTEAFRTKTDKTQYCAIGSVKSNVGHTSAAAGVASVMKVLLCMRHKTLVPSLHYEKANEHIDFTNSPFYVNTETKFWETANHKSRVAAVSAFGFSGTNAHMILEEGPERVLSAEPSKPYYLITLSAKHPDALAQKVEDLKTFLDSRLRGNDGGVGDGVGGLIEAISYTLNTGRSHFNHRLALVVSSLEDLKDKLAEARTQNKVKNIFRGAVEQEPEDGAIYKKVLETILEELKTQSSVDLQKYKNNLEALANLYVKGYELDWELVHQGEAHQRISLPTYPLLKERYWVAVSTKAPSVEIKTEEDGSEREDNQQDVEQPVVSLAVYQPSWQLRDYPAHAVDAKEDSIWFVTAEEFKIGWAAREAQQELLKHKMEELKNLQTIVLDMSLELEESSNIAMELKDPQAVKTYLEGLFHWVQCYVELYPHKPCQWLIVYAEHPERISYGTLFSGFMKSLHQEWSLIEGRVIGFDTSYAAEQRRQCIVQEALLEASRSEVEVRYGPQGREVKCYEISSTCLSETVSSSIHLVLKSNGVYLITGGLGGLGYQLAQDLAARYQAKLVLTGRSELNDAKKAQLNTLERMGAEVIYLQGDVAILSEVEQWQVVIQSRFGAVSGIFHCAGILKDHPFSRLQWNEMETILSPKLEGTVNLDTVFQEEALDFLCLFSSTSSILGAAKACDYASANGYLTDFANWRNHKIAQKQRYGQTFSIHWPLWADGGMQGGVDYEVKVRNY